MLIRLVAAMLVACSPGAAAHDIPNDVRVQTFVRPEGSRLLFLVRVPLAAMNEVDVPLRGDGFLDLDRAQAALSTAAMLWLADNLDVFEGDVRLAQPRIAAIRVSLPSDRSFATWEGALAHVTGPPLPASLDLHWSHQLLDVLFEFGIAAERAAFTIDPRFARLGQRVVTTIRFLPAGGVERAFEVVGSPGPIALDPSGWQAARTFVVQGFLHILDGTDHLLFLLCVVIPFRRLAPLLVIITSFTIAHSVTLFASALGYAPGALWFPPLIETAIAMSILYMALENVVGSNVERRWMITFVFGLVHGFGFSFALRETLQFAGSHLVTALLAFNVGVELGQLLVILVLVPALGLLFRVVPERIGTIILSALVAHVAWHWTVERGEVLLRFPRPALDAATIAAGMRWALALIVLGCVLWLGNRALRRAGWLGAAAGAGRGGRGAG